MDENLVVQVIQSGSHVIKTTQKTRQQNDCTKSVFEEKNAVQ